MGTVMVFDKPWEGDTSSYVTVFKDTDSYKMYYRGVSSPPGNTITSLVRADEHKVPAHPLYVCYAESQDGVIWTRPNLGIYEFNGSKDNNIVWSGVGTVSFAPFKDDNPMAIPEQRYKAVSSDRDSVKNAILLGFVSSDGKNWRQVQEKPIVTDGAFDSLNVAFWDAYRGQYTLIYRDFVHGLRTIKYATSSDFLHWTAGQLADFGNSPSEHLYTNGTVPYFRAPQIYIAIPRRFMPWKTYFPESEPGNFPGISDAVFMSTRDGVHWKRFEEAFIRPGRNERDWVHRSNTPVHGMLPTAEDEISIYMERNYTFPSNHLERFVIRTDGFVSVNADAHGGEFITKPLVFSGDRLVLNYSTSAKGSIRVEVQDSDGRPIPGFLLEDSPLIFGDKIAAVVPWKQPHGLTDNKLFAKLAGKPVRFRFVMRDADLYSMMFK